MLSSFMPVSEAYIHQTSIPVVQSGLESNGLVIIVLH